MNKEQSNDPTKVTVNNTGQNGTVGNNIDPTVAISPVEDDNKSRSSTKSMTSDQKFTLLSLSVCYFFQAAFYSMLGPFFPEEAKKKGASQTEIGLIFGVFELVIFITSPFFGRYLTKIGAKFMFVAGLASAGVCNFLFGFLDQSPEGWIYVGLCFAVRSVEGLGCAAFGTAAYAIMAYTFPDQVSSMFGLLETTSGIGMMAGPVMGGALYQAGGFRLPFMLTGGFVIAVALLCVWLLPSHDNNKEPFKGSILSLFKIPITWLMFFTIFIGACEIGFLDVSYANHLLPFHLSPLLVGLVFLVGPGVYALGAPFLGCILDKKGWCKSAMTLGGILCAVAFMLMGPAPFLSLPREALWLNIVASVILGLGFGTLLVPPLQELVFAAFKHGFPDNLDTYGIASGLYTSAFSLGAFVGPIGGGFLLDRIGFPLTALVAGGMALSCSMLLVLYWAVTKCCCPELSVEQGSREEKSPLIPSQSADRHSRRTYSDLKPGENMPA